MMTINALVAADSLIIPTQANYLSAKGLDLLFGSVSKVRRTINPGLKIDGILLTMVESRTNNARNIISSLKATIGQNIRVFDTEIPHSVRAAECSLKGQSNDNSSDGNITDYLEGDSDKNLDSDVFMVLKKIVDQNDRELKSVHMVQDADLLPRVSYYEAIIPSNQTNPMKRAWDRRLWYEQSRLFLRDADLIFADPDMERT